MAAHSAPATLLSVPADQPPSGYPEWLREMARALNLIAEWSERQTAYQAGIAGWAERQEVPAATFATLPATPAAGTIAFITDGSIATWGSNAAGGGTTPMLLWFNGAAWKVMGV